MEMYKRHALELMKQKRSNCDQIVEFCRSSKAFLKFLDASGVNQFVANYVKEDPERLLSFGSLHPRHTANILADGEEILRLGFQMIKIHPRHQLLFPSGYLRGAKELEIVYRTAEADGAPDHANAFRSAVHVEAELGEKEKDKERKKESRNSGSL